MKLLHAAPVLALLGLAACQDTMGNRQAAMSTGTGTMSSAMTPASGTASSQGGASAAGGMSDVAGRPGVPPGLQSQGSSGTGQGMAPSGGRTR
jgi:hypothetical protein